MTILEDFRDLYLGQQHMYNLVVISIELKPLFLHMFVYLHKHTSKPDVSNRFSV